MRWQRVPTRDLPIREPARETRWALGYALFYSAAAVGVGLLIRAAPAPLWGARMLTLDLWYIVLFKICLLLVVPAVAFYRLGYRAADLLMGWDRLRWRGARLALAYAAGFCLNLGHLSAIRAAAEALPAAGAAARIGLGVALPLFMAGLPEEVFFRGILQSRLEVTAGRAVAIPLTALLFTAWHLPTRYLLAQGVEGRAGDLGSVLLGTGVPVLLVGLVFGLAWDRYRNLPTLIAAHWGVDTLPAVRGLLGGSF